MIAPKDRVEGKLRELAQTAQTTTYSDVGRPVGRIRIDMLLSASAGSFRRLVRISD